MLHLALHRTVLDARALLCTAVFCTAVLACPAAAQHVYATIPSPGNAFFGEGAVILGDLDGDGCDEYVVTDRIEHHLFSGRTGVELPAANGTPGFGTPGNDNRATAAAGDFNNDGVPDVIVGKEGSFGPPSEGEATVYSGVDWSVLARWTGGVVGEGFARAVAGLGDVDGDGYDDVAVLSPERNSATAPGYVDVFSGRTQTRLRRFLGGYAVGSPGDVDGDGLADVATTGTASAQPGTVTVYSVVSGVVLQTWSGGRTFGGGTGLGDLDGDGCDEVAISEYRFGVGGAVHVFSGATGLEIRTFLGTQTRQDFGSGLVRLGDITGDGRAEILVGSRPQAELRTIFAIDVWNGPANGPHLFTVRGPSAFTYGWLGAGGDVNGDGTPDGIVGAPQPGLPAPSGYVEVISGTALSLTTDTPFVSLSTGGTQALSVDHGAGHAGNTYLLLGSASGISPGLTLTGVYVPLNYDGYLVYSAQFPNLAPLGNTLGTLDANGRAQATWTLPPGLPAGLAGLSLEHASIVISGTSLVDSSNAMPMTLVN